MLRSGAVCLPGSRDRGGRALLTVCARSSVWSRPDRHHADLCRLLLYYRSILREDVQASGLTVLIDARGTAPPSVLFSALRSLQQENTPGSVYCVLLLVDKDSSLHVDQPAGPQVEVLRSLKSLHTHVGLQQVPAQLGGSLTFSQNSWLCFRLRVEQLSCQCENVIRLLQETMAVLQATPLPAEAQDAELLLSRSKQAMHSVLEDSRLVQLQKEGGASLSWLRLHSAVEEEREAVEKVSALYNQVDELLHSLVTLSNRRSQELSFIQDFSRLERAFGEQTGEVQLQAFEEHEDSLELLIKKQLNFKEFYTHGTCHSGCRTTSAGFTTSGHACRTSLSGSGPLVETSTDQVSCSDRRQGGGEQGVCVLVGAQPKHRCTRMRPSGLKGSHSQQHLWAGLLQAASHLCDPPAPPAPTSACLCCCGDPPSWDRPSAIHPVNWAWRYSPQTWCGGGRCSPQLLQPSPGCGTLPGPSVGKLNECLTGRWRQRSGLSAQPAGGAPSSKEETAEACSSLSSLPHLNSCSSSRRQLLRKTQSLDSPSPPEGVARRPCPRTVSGPVHRGHTGVLIRGLEVSSTEVTERTLSPRLSTAHGCSGGGPRSSGGPSSSPAAPQHRAWARSKLRHIVEEMVTTEREYVRSLHYIIHHYFPEMERADLPQDLRGKRSVVFGNLEKLLDFHSQYFLKELEACWKHPLRAPHCFLRHQQEQFGLYALYSKNKPKSDALLASHGTEFFRGKQMELGDKMDLSSYLLKPVQRMSKYALLLTDLMKEVSSSQEAELSTLQAATSMVKFQLRHGNDLLAMDAIRECDVNLKEQGQLIRQDEFTVWTGRRRCQRHVFLFQELVLFSKPKKMEGALAVFIYKHSFKTADVGLTETAGNNGLQFEIWFRRRRSKSNTVILQAPTEEVKNAWTADITRILWAQATRNKELRLKELVSMGVGNKPFLDIQPSEAAISDRAVHCIMKSRGARTRASVAVSAFDHSASFKPGALSSGSAPSPMCSSSLLGPLDLHAYRAGPRPPPLTAPSSPPW
uniref:Pleckstrin homology domain containing, family G (with RhoGef domain) member 4 n=1 Tax=Tetraodon nigroviridis TaxID=99883 RepID=H3CXY2_TETNG